MTKPLPMEDLRKMWQSTKQYLKTTNPNNPKVKQLLKSFDQGLGPAMDRFIKAGTTGNAPEGRKAMEQIWKILKEYDAKVRAVPMDAWADTSAGQSLARTKALGTIGGLQDLLKSAKKKFPNAFGSVTLG